MDRFDKTPESHPESPQRSLVHTFDRVGQSRDSRLGLWIQFGWWAAVVLFVTPLLPMKK
jgi:hypothetical protein